jgi:hypothetical protein
MVGLFGGGFWWLTNQREGIANMPSTQAPVIAQQLYQLPDPGSRFSFSQVHRLPLHQWEQVSAINFGFKGGTGWATSRIHSPQHQSVILELQSHFIDTVKVWLVSEKGLVSAYPLQDFGTCPIAHLTPSFIGILGLNSPWKPTAITASLSAGPLHRALP